jgi:hypothetical protein
MMGVGRDLIRHVLTNMKLISSANSRVQKSMETLPILLIFFRQLLANSL